MPRPARSPAGSGPVKPSSIPLKATSLRGITTVRNCIRPIRAKSRLTQYHQAKNKIIVSQTTNAAHSINTSETNTIKLDDLENENQRTAPRDGQKFLIRDPLTRLIIYDKRSKYTPVRLSNSTQNAFPCANALTKRSLPNISFDTVTSRNPATRHNSATSSPKALFISKYNIPPGTNDSAASEAILR